MKKIYYLLFILFFCFTGAMAQTFPAVECNRRNNFNQELDNRQTFYLIFLGSNLQTLYNRTEYFE